MVNPENREEIDKNAIKDQGFGNEEEEYDNLKI